MKTRNAVSLKPKPVGCGSAYMPTMGRPARGRVVDARRSPRAHGGSSVNSSKRLDRRQVEQAAELVVARHAALAVAQDVDRRRGRTRSPSACTKCCRKLREVVQRDRARDARCRTSRRGPPGRQSREALAHAADRRAREGPLLAARRSSARAEACSRPGSAGASGRRRRTPRSASTGRREWSVGEPGMPLRLVVRGEPAEPLVRALRRRGPTSWRAARLTVSGGR